MKEKTILITFLGLHSTTETAKSCLDGSLFPQPQTPSSLRTKPLIRPTNRVLGNLHDYLNPQNNSRYHYYPQKRKLRLRDKMFEK